MNFKNKKILVIGMGVSGIASALFLKARGADVRVTESVSSEDILKKAAELNKLGIETETGGHSGPFCRDAEVVVVSPGVDLRSKAITSVLPKGSLVLGELELGSMFSPAPIIAITGTNGKSTVTSLVGHILSFCGKKAVVCGNIGAPLIGEVEKLSAGGFAVVEVSSFQLETIKSFKPRIAALLNVTEDHYERHSDLAGYKKEKIKIFMNQTDFDWAVLNSDFDGDGFVEKIKSKKVFFGKGKGPLSVSNGEISGRIPGGKGSFRMALSDIPLAGGHNVENVICSVIISGLAGADDRSIAEAIRTFKGLEHRFQAVADRLGVEYIDDSKGTNIDATRRALESLNKKAVLIAGGVDKGGDYSSIAGIVSEKVKKILVIGEASEKIMRAFSGVVPVVRAASMEEAVKKASEAAEKGEAVLLSPMCSSFDMFSNYKERGEAFRRAIPR